MKRENKGKVLAISGFILMVLPILFLFIPNLPPIEGDALKIWYIIFYTGLILIFLSLIRKMYTESKKEKVKNQEGLLDIFKIDKNYSKTDLIIISSIVGAMASKCFDFVESLISSEMPMLTSTLDIFIVIILFILTFITFMFIVVCVILFTFFILKKIKKFVLF